MAKKRMMSLSIMDTDAFLDMPMSSQALYFHLLMRADDEGFIGNPKKIMRMIGSQDDDLRVLSSKRFILTFESGIVVIKHWLIHNNIRTERMQETTYKKEKETLSLNEYNAYTESKSDNVRQMSDSCQTNVRIGIGLGKDRIGKDRIGLKEKALADFLLTEIKKNIPTFKNPNMEKWSKVIDLMVRIDNRTYEQIEFIIKWVQQDSFWKANILSPIKLRKHFDALVAKVKEGIENQESKKIKILKL